MIFSVLFGFYGGVALSTAVLEALLTSMFSLIFQFEGTFFIN